ncbi:MAG: hypothetical protein LH616_09845 [Ilumatobacteraceae bacterium]|nr:hypothetical protein [Ilumatobacteraceae bacterium]
MQSGINVIDRLRQRFAMLLDADLPTSPAGAAEPSRVAMLMLMRHTSAGAPRGVDEIGIGSGGEGNGRIAALL